jgi:hypothetical protein
MKGVFLFCPAATGFCPSGLWSRSRIGFETSRKEKFMMDKNQTLPRSLSGDLSTGKRRIRYRILALLLTLGLTSFQMTSAQADCLDQCLQDYTQCLYNANGDPALEVICDDRYDNCCEGCQLY